MENEKNVNQSGLKASEIVEKNRKQLTEKFSNYYNENYNLFSDVFSAPEQVSYSTGNKYLGVNALALNMAVVDKGFRDQRWLTAVQLKEKGLSLKSDQHPIYLEASTLKDGKVKKYFYSVYNAEQLVGVDLVKPVVIDGQQKDKELKAMLDNCPVKIVYDRAPGKHGFYDKAQDVIHMALEKSYVSKDEFYKNAAKAIIYCHMAKDQKLCPNISPEGNSQVDQNRRNLRASLAMMTLRQHFGMGPDRDEMQTRLHENVAMIESLKKSPDELAKACNSASYIVGQMLGRDKSVEEVKNKSAEISEAQIKEKDPQLAAMLFGSDPVLREAAKIAVNHEQKYPDSKCKFSKRREEDKALYDSSDFKDHPEYVKDEIAEHKAEINDAVKNEYLVDRAEMVSLYTGSYLAAMDAQARLDKSKAAEVKVKDVNHEVEKPKKRVKRSMTVKSPQKKDRGRDMERTM